MRGAGRLLLRALGSARLFTLLLFQPSAERFSWYLRADTRRLRKVAVAVLAVSLLGGGRPILSSLFGDIRVGSSSSVTVTEGTRGSASVTVELPGAYGDGLRRYDREGPLPPPVAVSKRTALLIGINHARGGGTLPGSVTDATNVQKALLGYGFKPGNVRMLLEGAATRSRILAELDALARRTPSDGLAVFAVATHTRRMGGHNELLTADGARISAYELAAHLRAVRSKMWIALPTCYAGGYALPGIVGPRRIATFASSSNEPTYQLGSGGSYLILNMVRHGMIEGGAPESVESAFAYAHDRLEREQPDRVPSISDGIGGELVLGNVPSSFEYGRMNRAKHSHGTYSSTGGAAPTTYGQPYDQPQEPEATPPPARHQGGVGVCGSYEYNCRH